MKAPDFELKDLRTNQSYKLSNLKGKPIILTFWVSWCPDCQRDLPKKVNFYENSSKGSLYMLSINVTGREHDVADGLTFAKEFKLPFPALADHGRETYDAYQCTSVPTTVLINQEGRITATFGDQASFSEIIIALSSLLDN